MKKSLGRRSSSRNPPRVLAFNDLESERKDRKSGIPVRRAASTDRISSLATPISRANMFMTPMTKRCTSDDRLSAYGVNKALFTGGGGGTERPSRATSASTSSARLSSFGGTKMKRDNRPIEDRDWQIAAQSKIENYLMQDEIGCQCLVNGSIKPITLKMFIGIVDVCLQRLFGREGASYINKENYIIELPIVMKKLHYRGKIEKSWLISVNTARSWCHVLALLDFLVSFLTSQLVIDPMSVLYPAKYENEDDDDWNFKLLLPYLINSFNHFMNRNNEANYEAIQEQLDQEFIKQQVRSDDLYERITALENDIQRILEKKEVMLNNLEKSKNSHEKLDSYYNELNNEKKKLIESTEYVHKFCEECQIKLKSLARQIEKLGEELERKRSAKEEKARAVSNQEISQLQMAEMRQKRDSLQREIQRETEYLSRYEDMIQELSVQVLVHKKKTDDLIKTYNLEVLKYLPLAENALLDSKHCDEGILSALAVTEATVREAKDGLQSLLSSQLNHDVVKLKEELDSLESRLSERMLEYNSLLEDNKHKISDKEEFICNLKTELDSLLNKLNHPMNDSEEQSVIKENETRANKMEKQLAVFKKNCIISVQNCYQLLDTYSMKNQALEEEIIKFIKSNP